MSDNPIDFGDWFLASAEQPPPLENDNYQLPPNLSDSSFWNNLIDINIPNDQNSQLDNLPITPKNNQQFHQKDVPVSIVTDHNHLNTSPITTRVDPNPITPETFPAHITPSHRPPLAQIPSNPLRLTATPQSSKNASLHKSIAKNVKPPHLRLDDRPYQSLPKTTKQKSSRLNKQSPKRTPNHRAKIEVPLLSPSLATKKHPQHKPSSQKRAHEHTRERHNQMMRENRHRFNNKFKELTALLDTFKEPGCEYKPMKNKIQILERAIYQYAQMQSKRARYESELMFSSEHAEDVNNEFLKVFIAIPSLLDACNLLLQNMCATMNWKYGEAWIRRPTQAAVDSSSPQYELCSSVVSKNNMPDTRQLLEKFSQKSKADRIDDYLLTLSQHRHAVWIPNLSAKTGKSSRAAAAKEAGITTMFTVPIYLGDNSSGLPDAIITLMHVNDELLSYPRHERPYDSQSMTKLLDLVSAVVKSRAKMAC